MNFYQKRNALKAGFTIEAAVILPVLMVLIVSFVLVSFSLHDRAVLKSALLYQVIDQVGREDEAAEEKEKRLQAEAEKELLAADGFTITVQADSDQVTAEAEGRESFPDGLIRVMTGDAFQKIGAGIKVSGLNGRETLIRYKTLCDGLSAVGNQTEGKEQKGEEGKS